MRVEGAEGLGWGSGVGVWGEGWGLGYGLGVRGGGADVGRVDVVEHERGRQVAARAEWRARDVEHAARALVSLLEGEPEGEPLQVTRKVL